MKTAIHPTYNAEVTFTCACGETFTTGSTAESVRVEVCSACHPFYTGKNKLVDATGRVDRFKKKLVETRQTKRTVPKRTRRAAAKKEAKAKKDKTVSLN